MVGERWDTLYIFCVQRPHGDTGSYVYAYVFTIRCIYISLQGDCSSCVYHVYIHIVTRHLEARILEHVYNRFLDNIAAKHNSPTTNQAITRQLHTLNVNFEVLIWELSSLATF
jgi:hypothetical protein